MADVNSNDSVIESLCDLGECVAEAATWASIATELAGSDRNAPQWPFVVTLQIRRIEQALALVDERVRVALRGVPQ